MKQNATFYILSGITEHQSPGFEISHRYIGGGGGGGR